MNFKIGKRIHFKYLKWIIVWTYIFNVLDGILTTYWVLTYKATEANPFMAFLITKHPILFIAVKMVLVVLGSILLWRLRRRPFAVIAIFGAFMLYYFIVLYHLQAMNIQLFDKIYRLIQPCIDVISEHFY
ncbi:MAG: DUF5658 family protein [Pseudomonadota bacterium]